MTSPADYTWITLFSLLGIVCILSNGLVCFVIFTRKTVIGALNCLVLSLAITDILIGAVCVPMFVSLQATFSPSLPAESMSNISAQSSNYSITAFTTSSKRWALYVALNATEVYLSSCSIFHLCVMAFDRVVLVTRPIIHRGYWVGQTVHLKLSAIPWLLATIIAAITIIQYTRPNLLGNVVAILAVLILVPLLFIIVCYTIIFVSIRRRNKRFSSKRRKAWDFSYEFSSSNADNIVCSNPATDDKTRNTTDSEPKTRDSNPVGEAQSTVTSVRKINEIKMIKTLLCIIVVFMICWLPLIAMNIIFPDYSTLKGLSTDYKTTLGTVAKFFHYCSSACNPFIYSFFNPAFRAHVQGIFRGRISAQRRASQILDT